MRDRFRGIFSFLIRTSAFIGKEIKEVLRQTPLILTLVLGPFLIMLLFGVGYRNQARPLRVLVVVKEGELLQQQVEEQAKTLGPPLVYQGTTTNREAALQELMQGRVDVVVVIPPDAVQSIQNSNQAVVQFYHNEIDPYQASYVGYFGGAYIDEVNRRIVYSYAEQGQENASSVENKLADARTRVKTMRQALQAGDALTALGEQQLLSGDIEAIALLVGGSLNLLGGLGGETNGENPEGNPGANYTDEQAISGTLTQLQRTSREMNSIQEGQSGYDEELAKLDQMEGDLTNLETALKDFQSVEASVLVAPFRSETLGMQDITLRPSDFFAPAVLVLLLQHLAVTFSALAIVREQRLGSIELFRISPLSSLETLLGKYLSYLLLGGVLAAVITATVVIALKVPMLGSWLDYAIVLLTLIFTALGMGFLISLFARTEMQAVQYAMFVLLGSVFFSGFIMDLRNLEEPVRMISWFLPATYAIRLLQTVLLRGSPIEPILYAALLGIGVLLFIVAWFILRRRLQKEWS